MNSKTFFNFGHAVLFAAILIFAAHTNAAAAPANDNFAAAQNLGSLQNVNIAGTNVGATLETGEPLDGYSPTGQSVWYRWTAPGNYSGTFDVAANFPSNIRIYDSNAANPTFAQLHYINGNAELFGTDGKYSAKHLVTAGKTYYISIDGRNDDNIPTTGNFQLTLNLNKFSHRAKFSRQVSRTSVAVFRPNGGGWYIDTRSFNLPFGRTFGKLFDQPMPADYNGDGETEYAVVRDESTQKVWYISYMSSSNVSAGFYGIQWGLPTDQAATGDFDRDGRADLVAIRQTPNGLMWYVRLSSNGAMRAFQWGLNSDKPVFGDFDGDFATDIAVTRATPEGMVWYILKSGNNLSYSQYNSVQLGANTDLRTAEDYDNDGKTNVAVFRPENGTWYILRSILNQVQVVQFGMAGDKPQPADYDGDGDAEIAVFRPSNGTWYTSPNPATNYGAIQWGGSGDAPISSLANPQ